MIHLCLSSPPVHLPRPKLPPPPNPPTGLLFRQKLLYLETTLHLSSSTILSLNPTLRSTPLSSIISLTSYLSSFHLTSSDLSRIFTFSPSLLSLPPSSLHPTFHFLLSILPFSHIRTAITRCPRLLTASVSTQLQPTLYFLRRLGLKITSQHTVLLVSDVERTLIPKLDYLRSLGFCLKEVEKMVVRSPALLTYSVDGNMKPKVEFLEVEMGRDVVGEIRGFPQYFSFGLEARIMPRWRVLVEKGFEGEMTLATMLKVSDGEFRERVVELQLKSVEGKFS